MAGVHPTSLAGEPRFDGQSTNHSSMFLLAVRGSEGISLLTLSGSSLDTPSGGKLRYVTWNTLYSDDPGPESRPLHYKSPICPIST